MSVTVTLKIAHHFFHMTLWLMMMHHHTTFGYKRLSGSENIFCTKPVDKDRLADRHSDSSMPLSHNFNTVGRGKYNKSIEKDGVHNMCTIYVHLVHITTHTHKHTTCMQVICICKQTYAHLRIIITARFTFKTTAVTDNTYETY